MPMVQARLPLRHVVVVFGDQLDERSAALAGFDPAVDAIWMAEVEAESTRVWSHKQRIALFLAAMRHFREAQRALGRVVHYTELGDADNTGKLSSQLTGFLEQRRPERVVCVEPGEHRVRAGLEEVCQAAGVELEVREDRHFMASVADFKRHASGRKELRMEYFYREMRQRHGVLLDARGKPEGGAWNFDKENRKSFGKEGPPGGHPAPRFQPDALTREVLAEVAERFPGHPGSLAAFGWPVTRAEALLALEDFVAHRLPVFGDHQDAMWTGEPFLSHSLLASSLNLKLLDPREVIAAAEAAYRAGRAPLAAVEGFIRQILGWREYVRGVYWMLMPEYGQRNALGADQELPGFYWTGETPLTCLREAVGQTLRHGYAHHIQRLMVTGLYALLLGVRPQAVHEWYLAVYVDAVEWVELPNTLGMSQYADGGVMASKPYVATGKYIDRMSNYCASCPKNPALSTGPEACPFTTLYWDFLLRHEAGLRGNHRMAMQLKNLARLGEAARSEIRAQAEVVRANPGCV
jgi:deoxyribodipyrimidine photolyase-related protein